jgi:hypothetical protein
LSVEGDAAKAIRAVHGIKVYPLSKAGQPVTHRFIDVTDKAAALPQLAWEDKIDYWRQRHAVIEAETAPEEFRHLSRAAGQLHHPLGPQGRGGQMIPPKGSTGTLRVDGKKVAEGWIDQTVRAPL